MGVDAQHGRLVTAVPTLPAPDVTALLYIFSMLGVAVFAISGALAAARRDLDLIGMVVLGMVTATGGGTLRDVLIDRTVFWIADPNYILATLAATGLTVIWVRFFRPPDKALLYADAFGLAMFSITGGQIAEAAGLPAVLVILLGCVTGAAGGLLRDILSAEIPLVLRKSELYITTCIVGLSLYVLLRYIGWDGAPAGVAGAVVILALRLASVYWRVTLPVIRIDKD